MRYSTPTYLSHRNRQRCQSQERRSAVRRSPARRRYSPDRRGRSPVRRSNYPIRRTYSPERRRSPRERRSLSRQSDCYWVSQSRERRHQARWSPVRRSYSPERGVRSSARSRSPVRRSNSSYRRSDYSVRRSDSFIMSVPTLPTPPAPKQRSPSPDASDLEVALSPRCRSPSPSAPETFEDIGPKFPELWSTHLTEEMIGQMEEWRKETEEHFDFSLLSKPTAKGNSGRGQKRSSGDSSCCAPPLKRQRYDYPSTPSTILVNRNHPNFSGYFQ